MIMNLLFAMAVDRVIMPLEWETKHSHKFLSSQLDTLVMIDELTAIKHLGQVGEAVAYPFHLGKQVEVYLR